MATCAQIGVDASLRLRLVMATALAALILGQYAIPCRASAKEPAKIGRVASVAGAAQSTALPAAGSTAAASAPARPRREAVIAYLSQVIGWYRHIEAEQRLATEPAEILFLADDRQAADEVVKQAFAYARAEAALLETENGSAASTGTAGGTVYENASGGESSASKSPIPGLADLIKRRNENQAQVTDARVRLRDLQARLPHTPQSGRAGLNRLIVAAKGEIELARSRVDSLNAMIDFETGSTGAGPAGAGLDEQIDELERSLPQASAATADKPQSVSAVAATTPLLRAAAPVGVVGRITALVELRQKTQALADMIDTSDRLLATVKSLRAPLLQALNDVDLRGAALAKDASASDLAGIRQNKARFEGLSERHKMVVAALLPLSKQVVLLNLCAENLIRWRATAQEQFAETLRRLVLRLFGSALVIALVFAAAFVWRKLAFRYVQDLQRRHQLLQLRRLILVVVLLFVLLFDFANELGALATVMGLAAAGVALALQNVILSMAGYFYLSGRFGIRIGDRVQISGINGDVLDVGFFKLTMMELSDDKNARQPTGRVVVFPNSVVFQANGNFFKQAPGASFTWKEVRLTLAPECDYRLAEQRLLGVVNEVFARYRDTVQRESRAMESILNVALETPRPQSRLYLSESGLEVVIRYPAQTMEAAQTADEISRRLVDAIRRDPALKLVAQAAPSIQPVIPPEPAVGSDQAVAANGSPQSGAAPAPATPESTAPDSGQDPTAKPQE